MSHPSRREFLATTLAAAAASTLAASVPAQTAGPRIKLGVVGCGGRGGWIAQLFKKHGGYDMHAVCDYFPQVANAAGEALGVDASRRFSGLNGYQKLIESGVTAVALETPPSFFPEHTKAAVAAGLHVYMAKPIAADTWGTLEVEAAAKQATANKKVFLIDYQMPTDALNIEVANRLQAGAVGKINLVRSHYWGGQFPDPAKTANLESRLTSLIWCNDNAIGGGYHVNACIHPVQAVMWVLNQRPVRAVGLSKTLRKDPHGDSADIYCITFEFPDGTLWTHNGKHTGSLNAPEDGFSFAGFYGEQGYARVGYGGKAFLRGGTQQFAGGEVANLYEAGAVHNIAKFHTEVTTGVYTNDTVRLAVDSCLATILAREACQRQTALTWDQLLKEKQRLEVDLAGLKA